MSGLPPPPPSGSWGNVGPYATSAAPRPPMRSLRGLATALTVLFALIAIVEIAAAAALFTRAGIFDDAANGVFAGFDEASSADDRVTAFVGLHLVGVFAIAITFITWQFRHAKNAQVLGSYGGLGPGWAIGGWFIPLANYVLPAVQLHQSSRSSDVAARRQGRRGKGSGLVILWAILWALSSLTFVGGGGLAPTDSEGNFQIETVDDLEQSADSDRGEGVGMVFYALAALAAIAMVRSLSKRQTDAFAASGDAAAWAAAGGTAPRPTAAEEATTYAASSPDWAAQSPQRDYAPPPPPGTPPAPSPPPPPAPQAPPPADSGPPPPPAPE